MFLTRDNKILWRRMGLGAFVTAMLVASGIAWWDKPVFLFIRHFNCRLWELFADVFDGKVWIIASLIAVVMFCLKKYVDVGIKFKNDSGKFSILTMVQDCWNKTRGSYAVLIFTSVLSAGIIVKILKILIGRARPVFFEALEWTAFVPFSVNWEFNSMPSGHTAISFAGLVMIGMLAPRYKVLTWTMAILIGFSRVAIGAHWPTDVILGAFIGMVVADIVKGILLKK